MRGFFDRLILPACLCLLPLWLTGQQSKTPGDEFHHLRPGDVIQIVVFEESDLSVQLKLDPQGVVVIPLLGRTNLEGQSLREAENYLEQQFIDEEYLVHPQVTISIVQHAEQVFYIFGEVNSPGAKTFPPGRQSLDILEAITMAGDLSQFAKRSEVVLRRPIEGTNQEEKIIIDLDKVIRGNQRKNTDLIRVYPQDKIFVPERIF